MAYLIAAIIIAIIILVIIVVLMVPFQISMELLRQDAVNQGYLRVRWLKIKILDRQIIPPPKKEKKEKGKFDIKKLLEILPEIMPRFIKSLPYIMNIFESFLKSISIEKISLNSIFGLGDSADTAMVGGLLYSVSAIVNVIPNIYFSVEPDLQNERLECSLIVKLKLRLLWIFVAFLKALTKRPFMSLLWELRKMRGLFA